MMVMQLSCPFVTSKRVIERWNPLMLDNRTFCNELKAGMDVALNKVGELIFVHELQITKLLWSLLKAIDSFLHLPDSIRFDYIHFD